MIDIPAARFDDTRMTMLTAPAPLRSPTRRGAMALLLATLAPLAAAQGRYPDKPVKLIVQFPAGGAIDAIARPVAESMGKQLGQQFLVDNRAGAVGNIGTAAAAKSAADGYTLLVGTSATHGANQALFKKLPYDPLGDFEPILLLGTAPNVLVVNAEQGPKTLQQLIAQAKAAPGRISYASAGTGTSSHLAAVQFEKAAGVELLHVPYKGGAPAQLDLLGGNVQMMFDVVSVSLGNLRAGKLRALAVADGERSFALPDVKTMAEQGFKGVDSGTWAVLFAPKGTPAPVVDALRGAAAQALKEEPVLRVLRGNGVQPQPLQGAQLRSFLDDEAKRWARFAKDAKIDPE